MIFHAFTSVLTQVVSFLLGAFAAIAFVLSSKLRF